MTVLTKPFEEKKAKLLPAASTAAPIDASLNADDPERGSVIISEQCDREKKRVSLLVIFLISLFVTCLGILGGVAIYREYGREPIQRLRFHGFCDVPYDSSTVDNNAMILLNNMNNNKWRDDDVNDDDDDDDSDGDNDQNTRPAVFDFLNSLKNEMNSLDRLSDNFFKEEFELNDGADGDDNDEGYAKINVPDFRDGRSGRFLHDFKENQSCIIDADTRRCFVMPLDREIVLPPKSMYDLLNKMWTGFYNIDTNVVRKNMRVVTPAVQDRTQIAARITAECEHMNIYMLEKVDGRVLQKREAPLDSSAMFAEFSGRKIAEYDLINLDELNAHEKSVK